MYHQYFGRKRLSEIQFFTLSILELNLYLLAKRISKQELTINNDSTKKQSWFIIPAISENF